MSYNIYTKSFTLSCGATIKLTLNVEDDAPRYITPEKYGYAGNVQLTYGNPTNESIIIPAGAIRLGTGLSCRGTPGTFRTWPSTQKKVLPREAAVEYVCNFPGDEPDTAAYIRRLAGEDFTDKLKYGVIANNTDQSISTKSVLVKHCSGVYVKVNDVWSPMYNANVRVFYDSSYHSPSVYVKESDTWRQII